MLIIDLRVKLRTPSAILAFPIATRETTHDWQVGQDSYCFEAFMIPLQEKMENYREYDTHILKFLVYARNHCYVPQRNLT